MITLLTLSVLHRIALLLQHGGVPSQVLLAELADLIETNYVLNFEIDFNDHAGTHETSL